MNLHLENCVKVKYGLPIDQQNYYFIDLGHKVTFALPIDILFTFGEPGLPTVDDVPLKVIPGLRQVDDD